MKKEEYKRSLWIERFHRRYPFAFKLMAVRAITEGILAGAELQTREIFRRVKCQKQQAIKIAEVWINVAEGIMNAYSYIFSGSTKPFSLKNEIIKQFMICLNKIKEKKQ